MMALSASEYLVYRIALCHSAYHYVTDPDIIMVTKPIKTGQVQVDIFKHDLVADGTEAAKPKDDEVPKTKSEEVPWKTFLGHEWEGHSFTEIVILTPGPSIATLKA